jgi:hypothetical protein
LILIFLKFSTKFINFFTSKYYSNVKYNHSFSFLLRIFFERASKVQSTVANLGNVYRNSKWSDLKVQNIKSMHLSSFLTILSLFIILVLAFLSLLFRFDLVQLQSSLSIFFWPLVYALDLVSYLWLCTSLLLYVLSNQLLTNFSSLFSNNLNSNIYLTSKSSADNKIKGTSLLPVAYSRNSIDNNWVELLHSLYNSKLSIHQNSVNTSSNISNLSTSHLSVYINTSNSSYLSKLTSTHTYTAVNSSVDSACSLLHSRTFNNPLSLSEVNSSNTVLNSAYDRAISQNLALANQTRWAFKMSPISEKLAKDNFNFTQAKSLLGSPVVNSLSSSNNIWSSNSLVNLKDTSEFFISPNTTNLNYFEDSRLWAMKKLYFNLSTDSYSLSFDDSLDTYTNKNLSSTTTNSILEAYLLDYSLSYSNLSVVTSATPGLVSTSNSRINLLNLDNTIYQDSYNNYIFSLSSTNLTTNFNSFKHREVLLSTFTSNLK